MMLRIQQKSSTQYKEVMSTDQRFRIVQQLIKIEHHKKVQTSKVRTISTTKWKFLLLASVDKIKMHPMHDQLLLDDLKMIVEKIPEESFIEAIINMQPYKPEFKSSAYARGHQTHITRHKKNQKESKHEIPSETQTTDSILKGSKAEERPQQGSRIEQRELLTIFIEEDYLSKELSSPNHPFSKIIDGLTFLLENKYKVLIENVVSERGVVEMEEICQKLSRDVNMIQTFFRMSSWPLVELFSASRKKDLGQVEEEITNFIINFLRSHLKFFTTLRKILRFAANKSRQVELVEFNCPNHIQINRFEVPQSLQIEGCYVFTTNTIIQFSSAQRGKDCLQKLSAIRSSFYQDIYNYKKENGGESGEISGEAQMEIFKFILCKLKVFAVEVYSQLLLMEVLYGEEEIGFHYGVSSYMHSQLTVVLEAIRLNI